MAASQLTESNQANGIAPSNVKQSFWKEEWFTVVSVCALSALTLALWFSFDHRLPSIDESGHILNSLSYLDLFKHPHLFNTHWWYQLFTVNRFYPPVVHAFNGALKLLIGTGRTTDQTSLIFFNCVLTGSIYGITKLLGGGRAAAVGAAILINCYPELALINRAYWLDFPLVAMVAAALYSVLRFEDKPSWKSAAISGIALGLGAMTKQIAVAYLFLPTLMVMVRICVIDRKASSAVRLQTLLLCTIAALICAPWFLINASAARTVAAECASQIPKAQMFADNLGFYATTLPTLLSPMLLILALGSLVAVPRQILPKLLPLALSALGGLVAISTLTWIYPKAQYEAPMLIGFAVVSGMALSRLLAASSKWFRLLGVTALVMAVGQILILEFAPYPLSGPAWFSSLAQSLSTIISEKRLTFNGLNPHEQQDWGVTWALEKIESVDHNNAVWLNVLCNNPKLNVHLFELMAHDLDTNIRPTTSRVYTIGGDRVSFSQLEALNFQWYLIQSENQYQGFADKNSEHDFELLKSFIQSGEHFKLIGRMTLPDKTTLFLYRQN